MLWLYTIKSGFLQLSICISLLEESTLLHAVLKDVELSATESSYLFKPLFLLNNVWWVTFYEDTSQKKKKKKTWIIPGAIRVFSCLQALWGKLVSKFLCQYGLNTWNRGWKWLHPYISWALAWQEGTSWAFIPAFFFPSELIKLCLPSIYLKCFLQACQC